MSENEDRAVKEHSAVKIDISGDGNGGETEAVVVDEDEVEILDFIDDDDESEDSAEVGRLAEVENLRAELADLKDRSMRTLADFDNFRKRAEKERGEIRRRAVSEVVRDFLDVVDNLERAAAAGGSAEDLKTGVDMILRQLADVLRRQGVERVKAEGERFNPAFHEAVSRQEDPDVDEPRVAAEMQAGYRIGDKLLRASRVVVAVPPEEN